MAREIERKFLLKADSWKRQAGEGVQIKQAYLAGTDKASIRIRLEGDKANINIKSATLDISRAEYEYNIPQSEALEMIQNLCIRPYIEKVRYHIIHDGHTWEIDVFEGENHGLIVAEIELKSIDEKFTLPSWIGEEVSSDHRYYNVNLVTNPYKNWQ